MSELHAVAHKMVEKNKGILAADESTPTCSKRFESIDTESTAESRNLYRSILFSSKDIEKYLPYAASYTAAMSAANATPQKIFRSLAQNKDIYGEISHDSAQIYRDTNLLGYDLVTAIKMSVGRAASPWLTEFFQGMEGTLTAGGNLKIYFLNRAEHYMRENRTRLHVFLETLAMLAESYVVVAVAMPLFLLVMLVIMFWVSGSGSTMDESTLYFIVLGFLPMIHIAYSLFVWLF